MVAPADEPSVVSAPQTELARFTLAKRGDGPHVPLLPAPPSRRFPGSTNLPKQLIIAEKPSVAADIARVLGGFVKHADYYESDRYVLSSAVGHLLEIGMPEEEEVKRGKWTFGHLPAIPTHFELKPIEKNEQRLRPLFRLISARTSRAWSTRATRAARA